MNPVKDIWASGETYERYVGRWSRLVSPQFINWLAVPDGSRWLDVGCGTGALSQTILDLSNPEKVKGLDRSEGFIAFAQENNSDPRASFDVADAQALSDESDSYDAVVSALMLNFVPQPEKAASEMARVARPGGVMAAYVWDYAGEMQLMRTFWDTAAALDADAAQHNEGSRFALCRPEPLQLLFEGAGLGDVNVHAIDIPTVFRNFEDYWTPFLGGVGPAPSYVLSLNEQRRTQLRDRIRESLPIAPDGSISLLARAWAVRGIK
ncbi:MAG TPA: class I SAM-dependent methyltransferase [Anaerolineales bacterium]